MSSYSLSLFLRLNKNFVGALYTYLLVMSKNLRCPLLTQAALLAIGLLLASGLAAAQGFGPATTYAVGADNRPLCIALADVNQDGRLDVLTANDGPGTVSVLLGIGDGTFAAAARASTGAVGAPIAIKVTDVNHDGKLDLVLANASQAGIMLGRGDGTFGPGAAYALDMTSNPGALALGDINGDSFLDIATVSNQTDAASVLLGRRDGTFGLATTFSTGVASHPEALALGDVNSDGFLDLVVANANDNKTGLLLGKGDGTFEPVVGYANSLRAGPLGVGLADVNRDGLPDILTGNSSSSVDVFLNQGSGTFGPVTTYPSGPGPVGLVLGDVDGDDNPDAVTADFGSNVLSVLLGQGNGQLASAVNYPIGRPGSGPISAALGDLNGDGAPDLAAANFNEGTVGVLLSIAPVLSLNSSRSGTTGGNALLKGTRLAGATKVTFTSITKIAAVVPASSFISTDYITIPNTIELNVPLGLAPGPYTVAVTTPSGTTPQTSFVVTMPLAVTSASLPAASGLALFPNPANRATTLTGAPAGTRIQVLDALGRTVSRATTDASGGAKLTLPAGLASGVYIVRAGSQALRLVFN